MSSLISASKSSSTKTMTETLVVTQTETATKPVVDKAEVAAKRKAEAAKRKAEADAKKELTANAKLVAVVNAAANHAQNVHREINDLNKKMEKDGALSDEDEARLSHLNEIAKAMKEKNNQWSLSALSKIDTVAENADTNQYVNVAAEMPLYRRVVAERLVESVFSNKDYKQAVSDAAVVLDPAFIAQLHAAAATLGLQNQVDTAIEAGHQGIVELLGHMIEVCKAVRSSKDVVLGSHTVPGGMVKSVTKGMVKVSDLSSMILRCVLTEDACANIVNKHTSEEIDRFAAAYRLLTKKGVPDHAKITAILGEGYTEFTNFTDDELRYYLGGEGASSAMQEALRKAISGQVTPMNVSESMLASAAEIYSLLRGDANPRGYAAEIQKLMATDPMAREITRKLTIDRTRRTEDLLNAADATLDATTTANGGFQSTRSGRQLARTVGVLFKGSSEHRPYGLFTQTRRQSGAHAVRKVVEAETALKGGYTELLDRVKEDAVASAVKTKLPNKVRSEYKATNDDVIAKRAARKAKKAEGAAPKAKAQTKKRAAAVEEEEEEEEEESVTVKPKKAAEAAPKTKKRAAAVVEDEEEETVPVKPKKAKEAAPKTKKRAAAVVEDEEEEESTPKRVRR